MKRALPLLAALALPSATLAQGPLTPPPGGPQPSMKTLQQVEPRVDLCNAPESQVATDDEDYYYVIQVPGSYYLSRNLSAGGLSIGTPVKRNVIRIAADDVTLDLNGFQLRGANSALPGAVGAQTAIHIGGKGVAVRNGTIRNFERAVNEGTFLRSSTVDHLRVDDCTSSGIIARSVSHCVLRRTGPASIRATSVFRCEVSDIDITTFINIRPIDAFQVEECSVFDISGGSFLVGITGQVVRDCHVSSLRGGYETIGISTGYEPFINNSPGKVSGCVVRNVVSSFSTAQGISVGKGTATGCEVTTVRHNGDVSFGILGRNARDCQVSSTDIGFRAEVLTNCVARNSDVGFSTYRRATLRDCSTIDCELGFELGSETALAESCTATDGSIGFSIADGEDGVVLRNCSATHIDNGSGFGFAIAGNRNRLINCQADRSNSNFVVTGDNNHLDGCVAIATAIAGGTGFLTSGSNNTVVRCSAKNCSTNFALNPSTKAGPIVNDPTDATNPFSNFSN